MNILFLGDVVGRTGRRSISENLPTIRKALELDFVIINGENATGGMGISTSHAQALFEAGANCITLGDHAFDQKDMIGFCEEDSRIIRPLNYAESAPGKGSRIFRTKNGKKILVAQALGQVFMRSPFANPFTALDQTLRNTPMGSAVNAVIIDIHAEATSEKMAIGHWLDGRASLIIGTHTHIPTSDTQILPHGTGYQTDAGMCGDYNSVIGMQKEEPLRRFTSGMSKDRFTPATEKATLSGVIICTDDHTGLAKKITPIRYGGRLAQTHTL